ncbi:MAG: ROK family protein [Albidovulum sp.]|nr:ROK family protein [Albidovulum sp.]MDE0530695.1 ROK family protein [Albidovulum sp.]
MASQMRNQLRSRPNDGVARTLARVLDLVRSQESVTRLQIERTTELGRAIVADRIAALAALGLVDENMLGNATGGRAPRLVRFNRNAASILVATLDQTALGVAMADLAGNLLMEHHEAIDLSASAEVSTNRLMALFEWLLEKRRGGQSVWGLGISLPGPVQTASDDIFLTETPPMATSWGPFPLVETLMAHFEAPVWLQGSVETMTMGELKSSDSERAKNMLFVKIGKRIGAGMVIDGNLYRGSQGAAGLIGQSPMEIYGRMAPLDQVAGSDAIAREGQKSAQNGSSPALEEILDRNGQVTAIDVGQAAQSGDPVSMEIMARSGRMIGRAVAGLANLLNPSTIVLSGSVPQTDDILLAAVREAVYGESHPLVTRDLRISSSRLSSSAGLVGAAMVVVEGIFSPNILRSWVALGSPLDLPEFQRALAIAREAISRRAGVREAEPAPPAVPR